MLKQRLELAWYARWSNVNIRFSLRRTDWPAIKSRELKPAACPNGSTVVRPQLGAADRADELAAGAVARRPVLI